MCRYDGIMTSPQTLTLFEVTGNWLSVSNPALAGNINDPQIEAISGLATFTPRLPRGATFLVDDYLVTNAYNTLQQVWLIANPETGTFRLQLDGSSTIALLPTASPATVQSALAALPSVGAGNVAVTAGDKADSYNVEFIGDLVEVNVPPLVSFSSLYNGQGQNCPISVTVVYQGTPQVVAPTAIALPPIIARIWHGRLSTIDSVDTPGVKLAANNAMFDTQTLIYDVNFTSVSYNGETNTIEPFAFVAPTTNTPVCITDPDLERLAYQTPLVPTNSTYTTNWRLRAV